MRGISLEAKLSDSVRFLKQQIKSKVKIPTARQCLVFAGRQLEDDRTLADLVVHGAVVSGSLVIIQGSQAAVAADINGRAGTCISIDEKNGRCKVTRDAEGETGVRTHGARRGHRRGRARQYSRARTRDGRCAQRKRSAAHAQARQRVRVPTPGPILTALTTNFDRRC